MPNTTHHAELNTSCWTCFSISLILWKMSGFPQHPSGYRMQNDYFRDPEQVKNQLSLCSSDFLDFSGWRGEVPTDAPLTHGLWTVNKNNNTTQPNKKRPLTHHCRTSCWTCLATFSKIFDFVKNVWFSTASHWFCEKCLVFHSISLILWIMFGFLQHPFSYRIQND